MFRTSIRAVNLVYLISMLLVVSLGSFIQTKDFGWGLIATEVFLIFLPAFFYWRSRKPEEKVELGFKHISLSMALLCLLTGISLWLFGSLIDAILVNITGYGITTGSGVDTISPFQAILIFIGFALAAPFCEEILFRGVIQAEYLRRYHPLIAVTLPALLFAFFHLRLQGLAALLPISFALSYVFWRTGSLYATMLIHFGNNLMASLLILAASFSVSVPVQLVSIPAAAIGLVLAIVCLLLIRRISHPRQVETLTPAGRSLRAFAPLLMAAVIYLVVAGFEAASYFNRELQMTTPPWAEPVVLQYEIQHKGNVPVGEAICRIEPIQDGAVMHCDKNNEAFEYSTGNSIYSSQDVVSQVDVTWGEDMLPLQISSEYQFDNGKENWSVEPYEDQMRITVNSFNTLGETLVFPQNALVEEESPWRLSGMKFQSGIYTIQLLSPLTWREEQKNTGPVMSESKIVVSGPEDIQTPAGEFSAWRVMLLNGETGWYAVETPHHLIRYEGRMFNYVLTEYHSD